MTSKRSLIKKSIYAQLFLFLLPVISPIMALYKNTNEGFIANSLKAADFENKFSRLDNKHPILSFKMLILHYFNSLHLLEKTAQILCDVTSKMS